MKKKILFFLVLVILVGCKSHKKINIGFIGPFSGPYSELGIQARNGLIIGLEDSLKDSKHRNIDINIIYKDNQGDPEVARTVTHELINEGVDIIIGPFLSSMVAPVVLEASKSDIPILSPTASTDDFKGIDDNFIRLISVSSEMGRTLGEIINIRNNYTLFVQDINNKSYSDPIIKGFLTTHENNLKFEIIYLNSANDLPEIIAYINKIVPDSIVFLTNGLTAAQIIQNLQLETEMIDYYGVPWTKVTNVHLYGGKKIEGMIFIDDYTAETHLDRVSIFNSRYLERFQSDPTIPSIYTYEAINIILDLFSLNPNLKGIELRNAIISLEEINGVRQKYKMNEYGDVNKSYAPYIYLGGKYVPFSY